MRLLSRSDSHRKFSALVLSTWPCVVIEDVIVVVEGHVDEEPLLQVDLLVDLSVEPLLRYHAKVRSQVRVVLVELGAVAAAVDLYSTTEDTRGRSHNAFVDCCARPPV